jgi:hypothetical protein
MKKRPKQTFEKDLEGNRNKSKGKKLQKNELMSLEEL